MLGDFLKAEKIYLACGYTDLRKSIDGLAVIQNQIKEDLEYNQMSLVEYIDPFTGEPGKKNKK